MYSLKPSDEFIKELQVLDDKYPGIANRLTALSIDPISIAVKTNIPVFCEYYVNAGNRHVILFDIDEADETVLLNSIYHRSKLYRLINRNPEVAE